VDLSFVTDAKEMLIVRMHGDKAGREKLPDEGADGPLLISGNSITTDSPGSSPRGVAPEGTRRGPSGSSSSIGSSPSEEEDEWVGEASRSRAADPARTFLSKEDIRLEKSCIRAAI
jgi:hypothetical protein